MAWGPDPARVRTPGPAGARDVRHHPGPADRPAPGDGRAPAVRLAELAAMGELQLLRRLETAPRGLTEDEADARLARFGDNTVPEPRPSRRSRVAATLHDPFTLVLVVLAAASAAVGSLGTAGVVAVLAAVSCLLRFHTERRSDRAAAALAALPATTATVLRARSPAARRSSGSCRYSSWFPATSCC
ncbi:hypothetical protein GXW82_06460 [Streptacidiphilus sp. 4-A2]|nr:hypothetical protein [Streptacidiphilus sp. 4-A2]